MGANVPALSFRGTPIADRGEMLSLTDMWRAAGSPDTRRPADWLSLSSTVEFVSAVEASFNAGKSGIIRGERGRTGQTWAHWQVAMAYAKYLDPEFHIWCNEVVRARMEGRLVPAPAAAIPNFADPAAAARAWAEQYEARAEAEQKRIEAERTKAQIGSRREAVAMATAANASKQVKRLQIELDQSRQYATVKLMEAQHRGREFDWRLLTRIAQQKGLLPVKVPDVNYGKVNSYHADVWREAYALEISPA